MVPDILNKVFRLLELGGFPMGKKKRHPQMDHNVYPMRFGIVLKENPERYARQDMSRYFCFEKPFAQCV